MNSFKICPCCKKAWDAREGFFSDPSLVLDGYQVNFADLDLGVFIFTHRIKGCGTSLGIEAGLFSDMYDGPVFTQRMTGKDSCPGYCLRRQELAPCSSECECAYVREIIQIVKKWPKAA
jgi:hypothetical protein